jgi:hypothetical protein
LKGTLKSSGSGMALAGTSEMAEATQEAGTMSVKEKQGPTRCKRFSSHLGKQQTQPAEFL